MAVSFLQRRSLDPFSDAARFPTLERPEQQIEAASQQHAAAVAGGPNSVAARFDPLNSGSIFSRQQPGAFDAAHDAQLRIDPSNNFYNGATRRADTAPAELSSTDRYAISTGYQSPDQIKQQQGLGAIDRYALDTQPRTSAIATPSSVSSLRRRNVNGVDTFDNGY